MERRQVDTKEGRKTAPLATGPDRHAASENRKENERDRGGAGEVGSGKALIERL